jgi:hypothetical protein
MGTGSLSPRHKSHLADFRSGTTPTLSNLAQVSSWGSAGKLALPILATPNQHHQGSTWKLLLGKVSLSAGAWSSKWENTTRLVSFQAWGANGRAWIVPVVFTAIGVHIRETCMVVVVVYNGYECVCWLTLPRSAGALTSIRDSPNVAFYKPMPKEPFLFVPFD